MEVSNGEELTGSQLIQTVVSLTELPQSIMQNELGQIIKDSGHSPESLTIEQLREAMLAYLEELQATYAAEFAESGTESLDAVAPISE